MFFLPFLKLIHLCRIIKFHVSPPCFSFSCNFLENTEVHGGLHLRRIIFCTRICHAPFGNVRQMRANHGILKAPHPIGCEAICSLYIQLFLLLISQHVQYNLCPVLSQYHLCLIDVAFVYHWGRIVVSLKSHVECRLPLPLHNDFLILT